MKVLNISSDYPNSRLYGELHSALRTKGVDSYFFVPLEKTSTLQSEAPEILYERSFNKIDRVFFYLKQKKIFSYLKKVVGRVQPDIIHAHFLFSAGYIAYLAKKFFDIPYIVAVRNTDVNVFFKYAPFLRETGRKIMRNASKIIFLSNSYRNFVFEKYIFSKEKEHLLKKTEIIPNGIDKLFLESKPSIEKSLDIIHLLYVGEIDSNKNLETTVAAASMLLQQGLKVDLTVVGEIKEDKYRGIIEGTEYVRYFEKCPKEQVVFHMRASDIFVMPSHKETFGLVYAEAMSQGVPVIYSKGQGFDGQFAEGTVGYHVDSNSAEDIANAVKKILANYLEISENCIKNSEVFNWEDIAERYISIYEEIKYG